MIGMTHVSTPSRLLYETEELALSMIGMTHVSTPSRLLYETPSPSVTLGASGAAHGMTTCTSRSSMCVACSSYSTLTLKAPLASCVGQQLSVSGTSDSSVVARRHLST